MRLAAEGLVTTLPNRNTVVATIDFSTVPVYFDALTLMYRVTTRLAAERRREADLSVISDLQAAFARSVREADALAMITVNRDFHLAIARAGRELPPGTGRLRSGLLAKQGLFGRFILMIGGRNKFAKPGIRSFEKIAGS